MHTKSSGVKEAKEKMRMTNEEKIVDAIIADLTDRRGLRQEWEAMGEDIQAEIRLKWIELVKEKDV